jgi:trk system potassium uptake protein
MAPAMALLPIRRVKAILVWLEALAAFGWIMAEAGLARGASWLPAVLIASAGVVVLFFGLRMAARTSRGWRQLTEPSTLMTLVAVFLSSLLWLRVAAAIAVLHGLIEIYLWLKRERPGRRILVDVGYRPARALVSSFATLIGVGTILLSFPASWAAAPVSVVDALFTATSASCVTGLTTVDTATLWSPFGKAVILVLIQLGGLGIMAIAAAATLFLGRTMGIEEVAVVRGAFDEADAEELETLLRGLVVSTLAIEAIGSIILAVRFATEMPLGEALIYGVFHSISAFCNAGFALFSGNLVQYAADPTVSITVMVLIILGGFGFGVLVALFRAARISGHYRLPVHAKVVIATSAILIWVGALIFFFFEYDRSLAHLSLPGKVLASVFQSVTPRTAGYNTVAMGDLHPVTVLVLIALMFIGASPGSTGGGAKTSTVAVVFLAIRAYLTDRQDVEVFGRRLSSDNVMRALALLGGYTMTYVVGVGLLLTTETAEFHRVAFEAASALGTVGLSMDLTPTLSTAGKLIAVSLMFVGRVGPLTAAAAAAARGSLSAGIRYPEGRVLVG